MCEHGHQQLFLPQRHKNIERRRNGIDSLFHGVPLNVHHVPSPAQPGWLAASPVEEASGTAASRTTRALHLSAGPTRSFVPAGRSSSRQPPPGRNYGGRLRTRPLRRSAAHVLTMSAGVAPASASRQKHHRVHQTWRPLKTTQKKGQHTAIVTLDWSCWCGGVGWVWCGVC